MDSAENNIHVTNMDAYAYLISYLSYQWKTRAKRDAWYSERIFI
jgi:hypothetical protein